MSITTVIAIYFLIWWITLFAVLPFGMNRQAETGVVAGTDAGAPPFNVMWRKLGWTTLVASAIFVALYFAYTRNLLPFDWLAQLATPPKTY
jgi:predicted secreted protein